MEFPKPTRKGHMLDLWNRLQPNRPYSKEEIYSLATGLPTDTASNLIYRSINQQRGYLILDQAANCYFRSDSNILIDSPQSLSVEESEIDEMAIARNIIAIRKRLKNAEEKRAAKKQESEKLNQEIADLEQLIVEIQEQLQPLRHFFPASAA